MEKEPLSVELEQVGVDREVVPVVGEVASGVSCWHRVSDARGGYLRCIKDWEGQQWLQLEEYSRSWYLHL